MVITPKASQSIIRVQLPTGRAPQPSQKDRSIFRRKESKQISRPSNSNTTAKLEEQAPWRPSRSTGDLTIEEMILLRSRTTVAWSGDKAGTVSLIVDESSVLEGRSLANFTRITSDASDGASGSSSEPKNMAVALVPHSARVGDMIIALKGGRLPFIVRKTTHDVIPCNKVEDGPVLPLMLCGLVRECSVNGYKELDSVFVPEIAEKGDGDYEFVFGDVNPKIGEPQYSKISNVASDV